MKYNKVIMALFCGTLTFSGCCGLLDEEYTDTQLSRETVYTDETDAEQRLNSAYGILTQYIYNMNLIYTYATNSDVELIDEGKNTKTSTNDSKGYMNYVMAEGAKSWTTTTQVWNAIYEEIETCNDIIEGIDKYNESPSTSLKQTRAQAIVLRALMYMEASRIFGDLPLMMEPSKSDLSNVYKEKSDRDYILDLQLDALREAIKDLDGFNSGDRTHVSKYYAECLFAQIALQRCGYAIREDVRNAPYADQGSNYVDVIDGVTYPYQDASTDEDSRKQFSDSKYKTMRPNEVVREKYYKEALAMLADVINNGGYSLYPDYKEYWKQVNLRAENLCENIFEIPVGYNLSGDLGSRIGVRLNWETTVPKNTFGVGTNGNMKLVMPLYDSYCRAKDDDGICNGDLNNDDARRDVTCSMITVQSDSTRIVNGVSYSVASESPVTSAFGLYVGKWDARILYQNDANWRQQNMNASASWSYGIRPIRMRYAQVLLYYAEILNELVNHFGISRATLASELGVSLDVYKNPRAAIAAVHDRAYGSSQGTSWISNTYDGIMQAIEDENMKEFAGEGFRKWDLIRWNLLVYKILEMKETYRKNFGDLGSSYKIYAATMYWNNEQYGYAGENPASSPSRIKEIQVYTDGDAPSPSTNAASGFGKSGSSDPIQGQHLITVSAGLVGKAMSRAEMSSIEVESGVKNRYLMPLTTTIINNSNHNLKNSYGY